MIAVGSRRLRHGNLGESIDVRSGFGGIQDGHSILHFLTVGQQSIVRGCICETGRRHDGDLIDLLQYIQPSALAAAANQRSCGVDHVATTAPILEKAENGVR